MSTDLTPVQLATAVSRLPGFTRWTGMRLRAAEVGVVEFEMTRRPDLLQFNGYFHGAVIAGLADHAAGGAVTTALPAGRIGVTIDMHLSFLAPADGDQLVARANARRIGTTVSVATVEVLTTTSAGGEQTVALATVALRSVPAPDLRPGESELGPA